MAQREFVTQMAQVSLTTNCKGATIYGGQLTGANLSAPAAGKSDPYALIFWNGQQVGKTEAIFETLDPIWDEEFAVDLAFTVDELGAMHYCTNSIRVELYDLDADTDDFLGQIEVSLPGGHEGDAFEERTFALSKKKVYASRIKGSNVSEGAEYSKEIMQSDGNRPAVTGFTSDKAIQGRNSQRRFDRFDLGETTCEHRLALAHKQGDLVQGTIRIGLHKELWAHVRAVAFCASCDRLLHFILSLIAGCERQRRR
jgi:Ca2+-dependent lipid-binding protein|eukprot:COSAG01_NODE_2817_length_7018_cov_4.014017_2_plen_255_part_00